MRLEEAMEHLDKYTNQKHRHGPINVLYMYEQRA